MNVILFSNKLSEILNEYDAKQNGRIFGWLGSDTDPHYIFVGKDKTKASSSIVTANIVLHILTSHQTNSVEIKIRKL